MSYQSGVGYAGGMLSVDAYGFLAGEMTAALIDVRTKAEWAYVGVPDLSLLGKTALFLEWQRFPSMQVDERFAAGLSLMLEAAGVRRGAPLVFICRSGVRSRHAATAMTKAGWAPCFNVADGFEGSLNPSRHRNVVSGWRAAGLPWVQT